MVRVHINVDGCLLGHRVHSLTDNILYAGSYISFDWRNEYQPDMQVLYKCTYGDGIWNIHKTPAQISTLIILL